MSDSNAIFTVVLDFCGGTYLYQCRSESPQKAVADWVRDLDRATIDGLTEEQHSTLSRVVQTDAPVGVDGLQSVWCISADLNDELALINVIRTH